MEIVATAQAIYPNGRGRRVPGKLGSYSAQNPILPLPPQGKIGGLDINKQAHRNLTDPDLWRERETRLETLRRRHPKRDGSPNDRRWLRGDWAAEGIRFGAWIALIAQVGTNKVGLWTGHGMHYFTREEIAERIDSHHRRDAKGLMRAAQVDRLIHAFVAAGLILRFDRHDVDEVSGLHKGRSSVFQVTRAFWEFCGVTRLRDAYLKRLAEQARPNYVGQAAPAPAPPAPPRTKAERLNEWKMRKLAAELASGHVPDYGPNGPPRPRERKPPS